VFFSPSQITRFTQRDGESLYDAWERFKVMLRLCPHHGLEKWLIVHNFYNGLLYTTKMTFDAAAGGALMNKNCIATYALIEDMTQNHYQWTSERAITVVACSPSKKQAGMYEVSTLDHLIAKVDALFQKFDKLSVSVVTPVSVSLPCEVFGIFGHTGVECQLGSVVEIPEQLNYAQYNQGMRPNQKCHNKTPQNPFGQQTTPPGYANNQRVPQKSSLELLLENYVMGQSKQLQELKNQTGFLNDSLVKLISKVDSIATHNKMLETQISQVAQQVSQPKTNQMNSITLRNRVREH